MQVVPTLPVSFWGESVKKRDIYSHVKIRTRKRLHTCDREKRAKERLRETETYRETEQLEREREILMTETRK